MTNLESRLIRLEMALRSTEDLVRRLQGQVTALQQSARLLQAQAGGYGGGSGGGGTGFWIRNPGLSAASGSWPTLTPSVGTADVYSDLGGTLTPFAADQTIRWFFKDAPTANGLIPVVRSADGSAWDGLNASCTGV
ncbi:hypothetical protein [Aquisphaera insulae]|uniref:hypothetical protein n=1 Tax=Aquisphaera insulae TaxID=2712864 RepID=UPI0013ED236C|nr:hypothetical protein [Aquisphaera insulae]